YSLESPPEPPAQPAGHAPPDSEGDANDDPDSVPVPIPHRQARARNSSAASTSRSTAKEPPAQRTARDYLYVVLGLALLPLVLSLLSRDREDVAERLERTLAQLPEEAAARVEHVLSSQNANL